MAMSLLSFVSGCKVSPTAVVSSKSPPASSPPAKTASDMVPLHTFTPEGFGAVGDGTTNDTDAFAAMTAAVNAQGGGTVVLRQTTYIVGKQIPDPTLFFAYAPAPIMEFNGCTGTLRIVGNGACLKCADGLRFGTFSPVTGEPTRHAMPYTGGGELASPYRAMIIVQNCSGKVDIENIELDGNAGGLIIGGPYGDTGWQIPASGLRLLNNDGDERVAGVHTHHHALDGLYVEGRVGRKSGSLIEDVISEYNGRQGCSVTAGCNYRFVDCCFNNTGKAGIQSAPAAGIDIEAETSTIRNLNFSQCEFSNNSGAGMVADSGDTSGVSFDSCRFIGTTAWAAWPRKPAFSFNDCLFVGAISNAFADIDPTRATRFSNCSFTDDPKLSPTGEVYAAAAPIVDFGGGDAGILFDGCIFTLANQLVLPWTVTSTYNNCSMSQTSKLQAYPRGTFTGINRIDGNVDLYSSKVVGQLILNGRLIAPS